MYIDMFGNSRLKINLHTHTTNSDGEKSPEEAAQIYKSKGYDAIAVTDHWEYMKSGSIGGLRIISGAEYDCGTGTGQQGVYHILMTGCETEPDIQKGATANEMVNEIVRCGGIATLAHPAWSLNTIEQTEMLDGVFTTEIYNSVSDSHESSRPYSGYFADISACKGKIYNLLATDDTHYYDGTDETKSCIMLEGYDGMTDKEILDNIKSGKFYSTQGPEVHIKRDGDKIILNCSPVCRISFFSNCVWMPGRCIKGENLTEAVCEISERETFIRAEITDKDGNMAWTNYIEL